MIYEDIVEHAEICSINNIHYFSDDQMRCLLAKNRLANVCKFLNDGWKPKSGNTVYGFLLEGKHQNILFPLYIWDVVDCYLPQFAFKTKELAQQAIKILGEETVKLALEPLGI